MIPGGCGPWSWLVAFLESAGAIRRVSDTDGDREERERRPRELASNVEKKIHVGPQQGSHCSSIQQHASSARLAGDGVSQRRLIAARVKAVSAKKPQQTGGHIAPHQKGGGGLRVTALVFPILTLMSPIPTTLATLMRLRQVDHTLSTLEGTPTTSLPVSWKLTYRWLYPIGCKAILPKVRSVVDRLPGHRPRPHRLFLV